MSRKAILQFGVISLILVLFYCEETATLAPNHNPEIQSAKLLGNGVEAGRFDTLVCLATDTDNDSLSYIWIAPAGLFAGSGDTVFWLAPDEVSEYPIYCRVEDGHGGSAEINFDIQVFPYDSTEYEWTIYNRDNSGLPMDYLWYLKITGDDIVWTLDEMHNATRFDGSTWQTWSTATWDDGNGLDVDSEGNAWVTAYRDYIIKVDGIDTTRIGHPGGYSDAIAIDNLDNIWVGGSTFGLLKFDGTSWTSYDTINSGLPSNDVGSMGFDNNNDLWCSSGDAVVHYDGVSWTVHNNINVSWWSSITFDKYNRVWVGLRYGDIAIYDRQEWITIPGPLAYAFISAIVIDDDNNVWYAYDGGIAVLNGDAAAMFGVDHWRHIYTIDNSPLPGEWVTTLGFDSQNNLWGGTFGYGLFKMTPIDN